MRVNVYCSAVFAGVDLFVLQLYRDMVVPSTILNVRKLETLGYQMVKIASLCVP